MARVRSELDWIAQRRLWAPLSEAQLARYARLMDVEKMLQREASHGVRPPTGKRSARVSPP